MRPDFKVLGHKSRVELVRKAIIEWESLPPKVRHKVEVAERGAITVFDDEGNASEVTIEDNGETSSFLESRGSKAIFVAHRFDLSPRHAQRYVVAAESIPEEIMAQAKRPTVASIGRAGRVTAKMQKLAINGRDGGFGEFPWMDTLINVIGGDPRYRCFRQSNDTFPVFEEGTGKFIRYHKSGFPDGVADITGIVMETGQRLEIETKIRGDHVQSPGQIQWEKMIKRAHGIYVLATYEPHLSAQQNIDLVLTEIESQVALWRSQRTR